MKSVILSFLGIAVILSLIITSTVIEKNMLSEISDILETAELEDTKEAIDEAYELLEGYSFFLSFTVPDSLLGEVRAGLHEAKHAVESADEAYLESIINRLIAEIEQIKRLGGIGIEAIF